MRGRTIRQFVYKADLWPLVDTWAAETGFIARKKEPARRLYRKGGRLFMAPAFLEVHQEEGKVTLEAWVKADFFLVISLVTGSRPETGIESGGLTAAVPRKRAREAVNVLLERLGQKPIA